MFDTGSVPESFFLKKLILIEPPLNRPSAASLLPGWGGGGGWGYSHIFGIRRLGPSIYHLPPKNIRNFKHLKKIFEIFETPKNIPILYLDIKKRPYNA